MMLLILNGSFLTDLCNYQRISIDFDVYFGALIPALLITNPLRNHNVILTTYRINLYGCKIFCGIFLHFHVFCS